tara:strand:+ start:655 stop:921 length:267 start_codon:yes stop_codon:yes gene_type:complete
MLINSSNIGRNPWNYDYPDDQWHHEDCIFNEDRTGFVCTDCNEEIKEDAVSCGSCKEHAEDGNPIVMEGSCSCDGILEDLKYGHHHYY